MPQRLYSSSDAPDYSTFPENPRDVTRSEGVNAQSNAPVIVEVETMESATYTEPQSTPGISEKVSELKERGKELVERASDYASDLKEDMSAAGSRWVEMAQQNARQLRRRTQEFSRTAVRDYPIQVILAAGLLGLLVGISLRVWRENRV
jgi:ElaB/YqjD/DUF883 family membrane-anchored ribosome-binding protein